MKIVLDTSILVRANENADGLARELLLAVVSGDHVLLLSNEMLYELARVLRYPRVRAYYDLPEDSVYKYIVFLKESSEIVELNPLIPAPIRDVNDVIVMQTAILGEADVLCARDDDFFEEPATEYLKSIGIAVLDDVSLMRQLRSLP